MSDVVAEHVADVRRRFSEILPAPSGINELDRLLGSVHPGWSTLIASREALGRTTLALQMALRHASDGGTALLASSSLTTSEMTARIVAIEADVALGDLLEARLTERDWSRIERTVEGSDLPVVLADDVRRARDLEAVVRQAVGEHGAISMLIVDDVNALMDGPGTTRVDAHDLLTSIQASLGVALTLTYRLDHQTPVGLAQARLLDSVPSRVARNVVVLEADGLRGDPFAHVIRTATGESGSVHLVRGPRSPRLYGSATGE